MSDQPRVREHEPIERVRARLEALVRANAAPRCGARSKLGQTLLPAAVLDPSGQASPVGVSTQSDGSGGGGMVKDERSTVGCRRGRRATEAAAGGW
jgi:hypothetical protein